MASTLVISAGKGIESASSASGSHQCPTWRQPKEKTISPTIASQIAERCENSSAASDPSARRITAPDQQGGPVRQVSDDRP